MSFIVTLKKAEKQQRRQLEMRMDTRLGEDIKERISGTPLRELLTVRSYGRYKAYPNGKEEV